MNRRGFLRLMGLGAAAAVAGPVLPKHAPVAAPAIRAWETARYKGWVVMVDPDPFIWISNILKLDEFVPLDTIELGRADA